jgi:hypothetical protein
MAGHLPCALAAAVAGRLMTAASWVTVSCVSSSVSRNLTAEIRSYRSVRGLHYRRGTAERVAPHLMATREHLNSLPIAQPVRAGITTSWYAARSLEGHDQVPA